MVQHSFLFSNPFSSRRIIPSRLYKFGIAVESSLKAANDSKQFDAVIAQLNSALTGLLAELTQIDTGVNGQKIDTRTVDELIADFISCMSDNENVIARQLGGKTSAGYLSFYPGRLSDYSKTNKTTMPVLCDRVSRASKKYAGQLEAALCSELESFAPAFAEKRTAQQAQIISVKNNRDERSAALLQTQMALTSAVYTVGAAYPGNAAKCHTFFPFSMLVPQAKRNQYTVKGSVEKNETKELLNHTLNKTAVITFANTGTNAGYAAWLAASPADPMPANAFVVNAGDAPLVVKAEKLGNIAKEPFVMIKNLSDINGSQYEVTFTGLKKNPAEAAEMAEMNIVPEAV